MDIDFMSRTSKKNCWTWASTCATSSSPSVPCPAASASVWRSPAVYFGAKVLILDEPTAALGVKQSGVVLRSIIQARDRGLGVIFITHNPHHAYPVGDRFLLRVLAAEIAEQGYEQEQLEAFVSTKIHAGESLWGNYPPGEELKAEYKASLAAAGGDPA